MIEVTKQQAANTFWLSYHTHTPERIFHKMKHAFLEKQQLDIRQVSIILKDKLCGVIGKMKPPISIMISGGVDSTLMLLMALECFDATQLKLFTADYDKPYGESEEAKKLAKTLGMHVDLCKVNWESVCNVFNDMNEDTYQEWFFSSSLIPTREVMKKAFYKADSILTGDGGDELFCGYDRTIICNKTRMLPAPIRWLLGKTVGFYPGKSDRYRKLEGIAEDGYESTISVWPRSDVIDLISEAPTISWRLDEVMQYDSLHYLEKMMLFDIGTELYGVEVPKVQTAARMVGNPNVVSPFLDESVMEFCCSLPLQLKYKMGKRKVLPRKMIYDILGDGYVPGRKKRGFAVPLGEWLKSPYNIDSSGYGYVFRKQDDWLNNDLVRQTYHEHISGRMDHTQRLWSIMVWRVLGKKGLLERVE